MSKKLIMNNDEIALYNNFNIFEVTMSSDTPDYELKDNGKPIKKLIINDVSVTPPKDRWVEYSLKEGANTIKYNNDIRFDNHPNTVSIKAIQTDYIEDCANMFADLNASFDFKNINTSNVTNMYSMFSNNGVAELDLTNFDTSNVTDMRSMFSYCTNLTLLDLSSFDTSKVTEYSYMLDEVPASCVIKVSDKFTFTESRVGWKGSFTRVAFKDPTINNY